MTFTIASASDVVNIWDVEVTPNPSTDKSALPTLLVPPAEPTHTIRCHTNGPEGVTCVQWNHNNSVLASGGIDGNICLSGVQDGKLILRLTAGSSTGEQVSSLALSSGSRYLVAGVGQTLKVFDIKHPDRAARELRGHSGSITCLDFGEKDSSVASGSETGEVLIHQLSSSTLAAKLVSDGRGINDVQHSPHRPGILAATGANGLVAVWDLQTGTLQGSLRTGNSSYASSSVGLSSPSHSSSTTPAGPAFEALRFSTTSANLLAAVGGKRLCFFDVSSKKCIREIQTDYSLTSIDYHTDGCSLVVGTGGGHVLMYDIRAASKPTAKILNAHPNSHVRAVKFQHGSKETAGATTRKPQHAEASTARATHSTFQQQQQQLNHAVQPSSSTNPASSSHLNSTQLNSSQLLTNQTAPTQYTSGGAGPGGDVFSPVKSSVHGNPNNSTFMTNFASPVGAGSVSFASTHQQQQDSPTNHQLQHPSSKQPAHLTSTFTIGGGGSRSQPPHQQNGGLNLSHSLHASSSAGAANDLTLSQTLASPHAQATASSANANVDSSFKQLMPSPHRRGGSSTATGGTPPRASSPGASAHGLNDFQVSLLRSMLDESLYALRTELRQQTQDLHMSMLRQFHAAEMVRQQQHEEMQRKYAEMVEEVRELKAGWNPLTRNL